MTLPLLARLRRKLQGEPAAAPVNLAAPETPASPAAGARVVIDRAATLSAEFPAEFSLAEDAATRVLTATAGVDLAPLARRSPALLGYDWTAYLRCSVARVVRVQRALAAHVPPGGRVLDFGSYFGNFALACRAMGYEVDAVDAYAEYGDALAPCVALQRESGIRVHDFAEAGHAMTALGAAFDAVVCAGVIEHIPHTPRQLLGTIDALLKRGGVLILDTPNLAYLYRRLALLDGQTIFSPIAGQFYTQLPFEGHHREYTTAEIEWMLRAIGHTVLAIETFNYSVFGQLELVGEHLAYQREMAGDPALREIIFAVSRRPHD